MFGLTRNDKAAVANPRKESFEYNVSPSMVPRPKDIIKSRICIKPDLLESIIIRS